jgi:hypothetical protein
MRSNFLRLSVVIMLHLSLLASRPASCQDSQPKSGPGNGGDFSTANNSTQVLTKVPTGVILLKGAWSSASDSVTPLPEGGSVSNNVFHSEYFGRPCLQVGRNATRGRLPPIAGDTC